MGEAAGCKLTVCLSNCCTELAPPQLYLNWLETLFTVEAFITNASGGEDYFNSLSRSFCFQLLFKTFLTHFDKPRRHSRRRTGVNNKITDGCFIVNAGTLGRLKRTEPSFMLLVTTVLSLL